MFNRRYGKVMAAWVASPGASDRGQIPNLVHFVYVLEKPTQDLRFRFQEYLSLYAAMHYWGPDKIYLHTNAHPDALARAASGASENGAA
ncbi:unnamed protein product [Parascedosporium putredinis]|uniref:Uncharacterized protein n=1 Tax=Parascedosporium putredinis TaxID=1442378 RepID=A0A9P1MC10_9PEZI|nr:unnamed protein product [Parascedosporium putredinis]CAI8000716.1 unnamed protein product [Parascedosporium putredinis]